MTNKILPSSDDNKPNVVGMLPIRPVEYKSSTRKFLNDGNTFKYIQGVFSQKCGARIIKSNKYRRVK